MADGAIEETSCDEAVVGKIQSAGDAGELIDIGLRLKRRNITSNHQVISEAFSARAKDVFLGLSQQGDEFCKEVLAHIQTQEEETKAKK